MRKITRVSRLGFMLLLALSAGCSDSGFHELRGVITVDGQPLEQGIIRFQPEDKNGPTDSAVIDKGHYSVQLPNGKYKLLIWGLRKSGKTVFNGTLELNERYLPDRYNRRSELSIEVAGSRDDVDFQLSSS